MRDVGDLCLLTFVVFYSRVLFLLMQDLVDLCILNFVVLYPRVSAAVTYV